MTNVFTVEISWYLGIRQRISKHVRRIGNLFWRKAKCVSRKTPKSLVNPTSHGIFREHYPTACKQLAPQGWRNCQSECPPPWQGKGWGAESPCWVRGWGGANRSNTVGCRRVRVQIVQLILLWFYGTKDCWANWTFLVSFTMWNVVHEKSLGSMGQQESCPCFGLLGKLCLEMVCWRNSVKKILCFSYKIC